MLPQRVLRRGNERIEEEWRGWKRWGRVTKERERTRGKDLGVGARFKGIHDGRVNSFSRGWATLPLSLGRKIGVLRAEMYR